MIAGRGFVCGRKQRGKGGDVSGGIKSISGRGGGESVSGRGGGRGGGDGRCRGRDGDGRGHGIEIENLKVIVPALGVLRRHCT